jgi:hypothetical protein
VAKCTANTDCPFGLKCDSGSGLCVEGGPAAGQLGGKCTGDGDCTGALGGTAFCATAANGYPNGYCSATCVGNTSICGSNGICVDFGGGDMDCLSKCSDAVDCRSDYYCFKFQDGRGVCTPKCKANTDCQDNQVCDKNSGLCGPQLGAGGTTTDVVDLTPNGAINVPTGTLTAKLTVNVPQDAIAVNFVGQAVSDPTARLVVYRIESSKDGRLYDYATATGNKMKVQPPTGPGAFSVLFPNSPNVPYTVSADSSTCAASATVDSTNCATLTITLLASKPTTATAKAIVKHGPSRALTQGLIDLNLYFVGLANLNATSAAVSDSMFQTSIFNKVKAVWAQQGIAVGTVNYIDANSSDAATYKDLKDTDLGALMQTTANYNGSDKALNDFFVHTISGGSLEGYIILGESAGIPGVPIKGTSGSGMAVTTADFPAAGATCDAKCQSGLQDIADTWAHEGGHWLGLFHPTESGGTSFDPLPDTPQCDKSRDANADGKMEPSECQGFGAENEMFWTSVETIAHSQLTPNQGFVLLRNPAVR